MCCLADEAIFLFLFFLTCFLRKSIVKKTNIQTNKQRTQGIYVLFDVPYFDERFPFKKKCWKKH